MLTSLIKEFELSRKAFSSTFFSYGKQSLRPSVSTEGLSFLLHPFVCLPKHFFNPGLRLLIPGTNTYNHRMQNWAFIFLPVVFLPLTLACFIRIIFAHSLLLYITVAAVSFVKHFREGVPLALTLRVWNLTQTFFIFFADISITGPCFYRGFFYPLSPKGET